MKKFSKLIALALTVLGMVAAWNFSQENIQAATTETPIKGVLTVKYYGRGRVKLLDNHGKYQNQYVARNTRWKVFAKAVINGRVMYRLGSERQWIPAQYSSISNNFAPVKSNQKQSVTNKKSGSNLVLVGNRASKVYHMPGEENYHIKPANRVYFHSEAEAIRAGYHRSRK